jgi:hypothetical protein
LPIYKCAFQYNPALCSDIGGNKFLLMRCFQPLPDTKGEIRASWSSAG